MLKLVTTEEENNVMTYSLRCDNRLFQTFNTFNAAGKSAEGSEQTLSEYLRARLNMSIQFTLENNRERALANLARYWEERTITGSEPPTGFFMFLGVSYSADMLAVELMFHIAASIGRGERNAR